MALLLPCRYERTHEGVLPTRFANAWRSLSSEGDDAVAAFAVYVRKCLQPLVSELTAVVNIFVRAWLIASRIVYMYIFNRFFAVKN